MSSNQAAAGVTAAADPLDRLAAAIDALAAQDLTALADAAVAGRVLAIRRLAERVDGEWLRCLAEVDARGAAGAETGADFGSTTGWLRAAARLAPHAATAQLRAARALHRGPLRATAEALAAGQIGADHAAAITAGLAGLPPEQAQAAEEILLGIAADADPAVTARVARHLRYALDPAGEDEKAQRRHDRRGLRLATTWEGMLDLDGLLDAEAGETVLAAINALAKPAGPDDDRSAAQRRADALTELARRALDTADLPETGGARPHLNITIDFHALLGALGAPAGQFAWTGPLSGQTARRLACDAILSRVIIHPDHHNTDTHADAKADAEAEAGTADGDPGVDSAGGGARGVRERVQAILRAALAALPANIGGARSEPLDVGRASRVVTPAQRRALAVRDRGCRFPGCDHPPIWCDAHHWRRHWLDGGATDLDELVLLCRRHHRAVHEGGWRIHRDHTGQFNFTPPPARAPTSTRSRAPTTAHAA